MFPLVAGSLAIALVEGQVFLVQGSWWAVPIRQEQTDNAGASAEC